MIAQIGHIIAQQVHRRDHWVQRPCGGGRGQSLLLAQRTALQKIAIVDQHATPHLGPRFGDLPGIILQRGVVRIGMEREAGVGRSVFVRAVEQGLRRQRLDAAQAVPELLGLAFEHPAAAEREHAIANEGDAGRGQVEGDVAIGVAANIDDISDDNEV